LRGGTPKGKLFRFVIILRNKNVVSVKKVIEYVDFWVVAPCHAVVEYHHTIQYNNPTNHKIYLQHWEKIFQKKYTLAREYRSKSVSLSHMYVSVTVDT
jgi:hypothetical protein